MDQNISNEKLEVVQKWLKTLSLNYTILELRYIRGLWLDNNQLDFIPPELGELKSLMTLSLKNNKLTSIPSELGELKNLRSLYLQGNQLTSIPELRFVEDLFKDKGVVEYEIEEDTEYNEGVEEIIITC